MTDNTELTADEFERQYAARSRLTVTQLRALGRVVVPCDCDAPGCRWQSISLGPDPDDAAPEETAEERRRWAIMAVAELERLMNRPEGER